MQDFCDMWSTVVQLPRMQCVDSRLGHDLKLVEIRYRHLSQNQAGLRSVAVDSGLRNFSSRQMSFKGLALWKRSEGDPAVVSRQVDRVDRLMDLCKKPRHFFHQKSLADGGSDQISTKSLVPPKMRQELQEFNETFHPFEGQVLTNLQKVET